MADLITAHNGRPGCREMAGLHIVTVRHLPGDTSVPGSIIPLSPNWPLAPCTIVGNGPYLAWRNPNESLMLSVDAAPAEQLLAALAPGRSDTALACAMSEGLAVFEMCGPRIDDWLAHLVDAMSIPRNARQCSRARMADIAVFLLRLEAERLWLVVDRTLVHYFTNWLTYSHDGAFPESIGEQ